MIRGLGTDVIDIYRVQALWLRSSDKLEARLLGPQERIYVRGLASKRRVEFLAGRFAAKEAMAKAAGCGLWRLRPAAVDLAPDASGRLYVHWADATRRSPVQHRAAWATDLWWVSITHTGTAAFAVAVREGGVPDRAPDGLSGLY